MSGYGTYRWTCGECGETFEASNSCVADFQLMRWRTEHKEEHRRERLTPEQRRAEDVQRLRDTTAVAEFDRQAQG